jgi:hypothetical protein
VYYLLVAGTEAPTSLQSQVSRMNLSIERLMLKKRQVLVCIQLEIRLKGLMYFKERDELG